MLAFQCPSCKKQIQVDDQFAGRQVQCGGCNQMLLAPTPRVSADPKKPYSFLRPAQQPDELGRLGNYRVLKPLGTGAVGIVFLAEDIHLRRKVALKTLLPEKARKKVARERFVREAQAAAGLEHDNLVPVYQVGEDNGIPFMAMKLLEGESLDDRIKREGKLPESEAVRIARETAEGLWVAHQRGLIHRDIKPANLWLEAGSGRVRILDFGLVRDADDASELTQDGQMLGTPAYIAPEQALGKKVDQRVDLFSVGCLMYRMLSGQLPFRGKDLISMLTSLATDRPTRVDQLDPRIGRDVSDLIEHLMEKDPQKRPDTARVVVERLNAIQQARRQAPPSPVAPPRAVAYPPPPPPPRPVPIPQPVAPSVAVPPRPASPPVPIPSPTSTTPTYPLAPSAAKPPPSSAPAPQPLSTLGQSLLDEVRKMPIDHEEPIPPWLWVAGVVGAAFVLLLVLVTVFNMR